MFTYKPALIVLQVSSYNEDKKTTTRYSLHLIYNFVLGTVTRNVLKQITHL